MPGPKAQRGEVFLEFFAIGQSVKVTAVDADSGTEVVVIGPSTATQPQLEQLALAKLRKRLASG